MIAQLNRELGVTIVLTTHVMEEAEELCSEIALLHRGALVAHAPTGQLTQSLALTRPVTVTLRDPVLPDAAWLARLGNLPGVTTAHSPTRDDSGRVVVVAESADLRATTPALLAHLRAGGLALASMRAEPVTLDDVFAALGAT